MSASLRTPILWLSELAPVRRLVTQTALGRRVGYRFVAGETLDEALAAGRGLARAGIRTMLNYLGENVTSMAQASAAADKYVMAIKRLDEEEALDGNISIKLTQLGLDASLDGCIENTERVVAAGAERGMLVMIDMESHEYVDGTLQTVRSLAKRYSNVGLAMQTYLHRTPADVFSLPKGIPVRLVKGAYLEPPEIAYRDMADVDRAFAKLFATLVMRGHVVHLGTHDPALLEGAIAFLDRRGIPRDRVELQMLYGIRRDLQEGYARRGHAVRAYIAYGEEWYPYLTRRLAERPANMWFFASNLVRR
jgi:proline dehydrogenase